MRFSLRFDLRNPSFAGTEMADRYAAALDMAQWADELGIHHITVCEHHGSDDGYLPSPVVLVAGMAARTRNIRFSIAALVAPFHDPLRIAEDLCVLDNISRGRVDVVVAGGYVVDEFAMFGVSMKDRPRRVTQVVEVLKAAFAGEPFAYCGRTVRVTPAPHRPGEPRVVMGGSSEAAARRAARIADGFLPSTAKVWGAYCDELAKLGKPEPGLCPLGSTKVIALAEEPDHGWQMMAPYFLHEAKAYAAWGATHGTAAISDISISEGELRKMGHYQVMTPEELTGRLQAMPSPALELHPLCGGMPIDLAWKGLRLFEQEVLPALPTNVEGSLDGSQLV